MKTLLFTLLALPLCGCVSSQFRAAGRAIRDTGSNTNRVVIILRDPRSGNIALEYYRNVTPPSTPGLALSQPFVVPSGTKFQIDNR